MSSTAPSSPPRESAQAHATCDKCSTHRQQTCARWPADSASEWQCYRQRLWRWRRQVCGMRPGTAIKLVIHMALTLLAQERADRHYWHKSEKIDNGKTCTTQQRTWPELCWYIVGRPTCLDALTPPKPLPTRSAPSHMVWAWYICSTQAQV